MTNTKVSALSEMTVPLGTDELLIIDDPGGTPASQRVSLSNMLLATSDIIPKARVYNNANISIPNGTWTGLTYNSERFDTNGIHSTVTNTDRLTCQTAGTYYVMCNCIFASNATGTRYLLIEVNGVAASGTIVAFISKPAFSGAVALFVGAIVELSVSDYVTSSVQQDSGGALNINYTAQYTPEFCMIRIGD